MPDMVIGTRRVGSGHPVYIVAEMSANHHQEFDEAVRIIRAAKEAGADAVKLQTYTADTMTIDCDNEWFRITGTAWAGRRLHDLYRDAFTPWEWQPKLKAIADDLGLDCFSAPFDETAVEFLEAMRMPVYKIASFECIDLPLLRRVARTGAPIIMSTGMATLEEIQEAVRTVREAGGRQLALLKCTSAYPAQPQDMHLRTIPEMARVFGVPVGLSDHTLEPAVPLGAVALGACIVEKHLTLSRARPGPDSGFSLEPAEFRAMVKDIRALERALGTVQYGTSPNEAESRVFRRSLFVVRAMKAGESFTPETVRIIRPGFGLHPRHLEEILSRRASREIVRGTPLTWDLVAGGRTQTPSPAAAETLHPLGR